MGADIAAKIPAESKGSGTAAEANSGAIGPTGMLGECLRRCGELADARSQFLTGLRALEETDHMYRDTWRGLFLCGLGKTGLEQGDLDAARVAFTQASLHLRGRRGARGGGHVLVQALAGLTRCGEGPQPFEEAMHLFEQREGFDFGQLWYCDEDVGLLELSRAASTLDRIQLARELLERACDLGSAEALIESGTSLQSACRNFPTG